MEGWVAEWIKMRRSAGEKCLEVKYIQGKPYVYHSTSTYDRKTKKPKKVSTYIGRLTRDHGLIPKGSRTTPSHSNPRTIQEYGNSALLAEEFSDILPILQESFPTCWQEIIALTSTRLSGYTPLSRVRDSWEKMYPLFGASPNCDPRNLSHVLTLIGSDRVPQQRLFHHLSSQAQQLVYDLSFLYSQSETVNLAEFGYNADETWVPQVHIALFSAVDTGLPVMIRALPGSVHDITTFVGSLREIDTTNKTLILDRGFVSEENERFLQESKLSFILPLRRNSTRYDTRIHLTDHFFYHKRLIHAGKKELGGVTLYLFEDVDLAAEEQKTLYHLMDEGQIERFTLNQRLKRAGRILILSSLTNSPQVLYEQYKSRNMIETHFTAFKGLIRADKLYIRDAIAVFGHVFIGFLCLYLYCRILNRIKKADLTAHISPQDLLLILSKVYRVAYEDDAVITETQ